MKVILLVFFISLVVAVFYACRPVRNFDHTPHPAPPNYENESNWFALPWRKDIADTVPKGCTPGNEAGAKADVFYIHPTMYFRGPSWNGDLDNKRLTKKRLWQFSTRLQFLMLTQECLLPGTGRQY